MRRPPRDARKPILNLHLLWRVLFVPIILMSGTFGLFVWDMEKNAVIEHARTVAVNTLVMFEIFYIFNSRYITASVFSREGLTDNRYVLIAIAVLIILQLSFIYLAPMQLLFGTTAIGFEAWLTIILISSSVLFLVEMEKYVVRYCIKLKRQAS